MGKMLKSRCHLSPVKRHFHFRLNGRHLEFRQSENVRSDIVKSDMVDNGGIAVGIAAPSTSVQKISSSSLVAAILNRSSSTSGNFDVVIIGSAMVEQVGVAVGIMYHVANGN